MKKSTIIQLQLEATRIHGQLFIERDTKSSNVPLVHFKSHSLKIPSIRKVQGAYLMVIYFQLARAIHSCTVVYTAKIKIRATAKSCPPLPLKNAFLQCYYIHCYKIEATDFIIQGQKQGTYLRDTRGKRLGRLRKVGQPTN